ncbi:uncharacterized protein [Clytia hemisphaerica]|uniref:uncharacterized protein n=1 Tax=Clytia hemisphaerica TaxID=252671 RepID=UPI0034D5C44F
MKALNMIIKADPSSGRDALPYRPQSNLCFLLNMQTNENTADSLYDGYSWRMKKGATHKFYFVDKDGKIQPGKDINNWFKVTRVRSVNSSAKDFHRLIITVENNHNVKSELAVVQYRFDGCPHPVEFKPHGNSKGSTPHYPTKKSVLERLSSEVKMQKSNKKIIHTLESESGGLLAESPGDFPRNERQVRHIRSKTTKTKAYDPFLEVTHLQEQEEDSKFIRQVSIEDSSPTVVLFTDEQLANVKKFCSPERNQQASIFSCDMTFKLGDFWVVITTYSNLMVFSKRTGRPVTAMGPVMLCKRKTKQQYLSFFQAITNKLPQLKTTLRAFGQDGEKAILDAHIDEFPFAWSFICSVHIARNIEEYIKSTLHLGDSFYSCVVKDVFGSSAAEGLYHSPSRTEFDLNLAKLKTRWNELETEERKKLKLSDKPQFFQYFIKNKAEILYSYCRQMLLVDANVFHHLLKFTTNATESINKAVKGWQEHQEMEMAEFIVAVKNFVEHQTNGMKKPFLNQSCELIVNPLYREHIQYGYWDSSGEEKKRMLAKVNKIPLKDDSVPIDFPPSTGLTSTIEESASKSEDINLTQLHGVVSETFVKNLEMKVKRLKGNLRLGYDGPKSRIVPSTGDEILTVKSINNGFDFSCPCKSYKSYHFCSHTIATAIDNNCLQEFLQIAKTKVRKLTPSATSGSSKNAGQKPNTKRRPKRKHTEPLVSLNERQTLGEILQNTPGDEEIATGSYGITTSSNLKMKLQRNRKSKKQKFVPTKSTPFCLVDIKGNISKCAGCRGNLADGPSAVAMPDEFDRKICIRHKEADHFYLEHRDEWIPKMENKHYHVWKLCLQGRNPHFNVNDVLTNHLEKQQINFSVKSFLKERLL